MNFVLIHPFVYRFIKKLSIQFAAGLVNQKRCIGFAETANSIDQFLCVSTIQSISNLLCRVPSVDLSRR